MINKYLTYILQLIFFAFLQGLIVNNIHIGPITPFLYIYPLLIFPVNTPVWGLLIIAFLYGMGVDMFSHTLGMHTFAVTFLAYIRSFIIKIIIPKEAIDLGVTPEVKNIGWNNFIIYASINITLHHFVLLTIEAWNFSEIFSILYKTIGCAIFTLILTLAFQGIASGNKR